MSQVDWSKAPEGTTGAMVAQWLHALGLGHVEFIPSAGPRGCYREAADAWLYVERPAWDGTGLPPVGTVCEWAACTFAPEDPQEPDLHVGDQVKIIAHFKDGEANLAAFTFNPQLHNADRGTAWVNQGSHGCFRPIRTPEQIAADEKRVRVDKLAADIKHAGWESPEMLAAYLDSHGYRKQVAQ